MFLRLLVSAATAALTLLFSASAQAGPAALYATGQTAPQGTIAAPDGSVWGVDHLGGFCRFRGPTDEGPGEIDHPRLASDPGPRTCLGGLRPEAGPGPDAASQPSFLDPSPDFPDSGDELAFVPDSSAPSSDVVRAQWNPDTGLFEFKDVITIPQAERLRPTSSSVGPDGNLYVVTIRGDQVFQIPNPDTADAADAVVNVVGHTSDGGGGVGVAAGYDEFGALTLYVAEETAGLRELHPNVLLVPATSPSFATGADTVGAVTYDLANHLLYAGTANGVNVEDDGIDKLHRFNTDTGAAEFDVASGFAPVGGLGTMPGGEVLIVDDPGVLGPVEVEESGRMWHFGRPVARITSGPTNADGGQSANPGFTNDTTPTFTFAGDPTVECALTQVTEPPTAPAYAPCGSGEFTPGVGLTNGERYRFAVRSNDGAEIGIPDVRTFKVDADAPAAPSIDRPTEGQAVGSSPFFVFGSDPGVSYECALDPSADPPAEADYSPCEPGRTFTFTADAPHTLVIRATDEAGNVSPPSTPRHFTVDGTHPTVALSGVPAFTNDNSPTVNFAASEAGVQFGCRLDGAPFALCNDNNDVANQNGSIAYGPLPDGEHLVRVHARDAAGNLGPTESLSFVVDTVGPTAQVLAPAEGANTNASVTFRLGANESPVTFQCSYDEGPFESCAAQHSRTYDTTGTHTIDVKATDQANNTGTTVRRTFNVGSTGVPQVQFVEPSPAEGSNTGPSVTFFFEATDPGVASFKCSLDGATPAACTSPHSMTIGTTGPHSFSVEAYDAGGGFRGEISRSFNVADVTGPVVNITSPQEDGDGRSITTVTFEISDASPSTATCQMDGGAVISNCTSPRQFTGLSAGDHTVHIQATDVYGNVGPVAHRTFNVNSSGPGGIEDERRDASAFTIASLSIPSVGSSSLQRRGLPVRVRTRQRARLIRMRVYRMVGRGRRARKGRKMATVFQRVKRTTRTQRLRVRRLRGLPPGTYRLEAAPGLSKTRVGVVRARTFTVRG